MKEYVLRKSRLVSQRGAEITQFVTQGGPKRAPWPPKGGHKIDKNGSWDALRTRVASRTPFVHGFWEPLGATRPHFGPQGGPKKAHGEARSAPWGGKKRQTTIQRGSQNGVGEQ